MRIVTDQDILAVDHCFRRWGELVKIPGREISNKDLQNADALLVRSITTVNEELLQNSSVKFVASATAGTNHIDRSYLNNQNIGFAHAPGANANAVVDYCFAALARIAIDKEMTLQQFLDKNFAIIGAGNVGGLFHNKLSKLGINCGVYDPILQLQHPCSGYKFCSLEQALSADIVSLHVPLTGQGPNATQGMLNEHNLPLLADNAILINTSRGGVIEEGALKVFLDQRQDVSSIVDVWCNEPEPDSDLISKVDIATPHIAGYSLDAKHAATRMIAETFANYFKLEHSSFDSKGKADRDLGARRLAVDGTSDVLVFSALLDAFALHDLSVIFKTLSQHRELKENFDLLRKEIAQRREFFAYEVSGRAMNELELSYLTTLGMAVVP